MTQTIEGPSKADREDAQALKARGWPYTTPEIRLLAMVYPGEGYERHLSTIRPSVDHEREAIDLAVAAAHGEELEKVEQAVAAAAARRLAAVAAVFAAAPAIDRAQRSWFQLDDVPEPLRAELREAKQLEDIALTGRANVTEKVRALRRRLAVERIGTT